MFSSSASALPAFPCAEGFDSDTIGGRGGKVIKVTNLNSSGLGSLQSACEMAEPRIVVFEVSGVINGDIVITEPYITIAGQSAPGAGITICGMLRTSAKQDRVHDVVVVFSMFVLMQAEALKSTPSSSRSLTRQFSISIHHNLFVHQRRCNPAVATGPADFRNNVVYNFRDGFSHEGHRPKPPFSIVANYYKGGPSDPKIFPFFFSGKTPYYLRDNYIEDFGITQNPWAEADKALFDPLLLSSIVLRKCVAHMLIIVV